MNDRDAFLAAIHAAPDDDAPRLVYSDWLEENGQPERAEFIRLQLDMWREYQAHERVTPRLDVMFDRQKALFAGPWAEVLRRCRAGAVSTFSRGFPTRPFSFHVATFTREAPGLAGWFGPDTRMTWHRCTAALVESASRAELQWVHGLTLRVEWPRATRADAVVEAFCQSPYLFRLEELHLAGPGEAARPLTARTCRAVAAAPALTAMRSLNLAGHQVGDEGVIALARSDGLRSLRSLNLDGAGLTGRAVLDLVASPVFAGLTHLSLAGNGFTSDQRAQLAARFGPAVHFGPDPGNQRW